MSRFIQLHLLTSYPPSNLNRDDLGRPKTAVMGGKTRLRISSQSLKRTWRTSDVFQQTFEGHIGIRTKEMGTKIKDALMSGSTLNDLFMGKTASQAQAIIPEEEAKLWAWKIAAVFVDKTAKKDAEGKEKISKKEKSSNVDKETLKGEQLVFYSNNEIVAIQDLINVISKEKRDPKNSELSKLLREDLSSVDVAMFGRMLANASKYNIDAAVQVAHAITVHEVAVEDDYFTAVDDLNEGEEDMGAAHIGETEFAAGVYYLYVCINKNLLVKNLNGNKEIADKAVAALVEAAAKVAPTGKQNSFASRAYASYIMVEKGDQQPRSLSVAYLKPVRGDNGSSVMAVAIRKLEENRSGIEKVYGLCADDCKSMNAEAGKGSLEEIINFIKE